MANESIAGVDVLAVLDCAANTMRDMQCANRHLADVQSKAIRQARAVVAELIEAAKEKQRVTGGGAVCTVAESNAVYRRMEAALVGVTGGA